MALNEVTETMKTYLPSTDSRLRPDIRKLEEGDVGMLSVLFCIIIKI